MRTPDSQKNRFAATRIKKEEGRAMEAPDTSVNISRRRFFAQKLRFQRSGHALSVLGSLPRFAAALPLDSKAAELLMVGGEGYDKEHAGQAA
jgi:hypothetical protein